MSNIGRPKALPSKARNCKVLVSLNITEKEKLHRLCESKTTSYSEYFRMLLNNEKET